MNNPASCFTATNPPTITVGGDGTFTFLFDVTMSNGLAPTAGHIQTFQGSSLSISNAGGVGMNGMSPPPVPEPSTVTLFGTLLFAAAGLVRKGLKRA
jgi:PEP-CTERM motif